VALTQVPFFPQDAFECGPAALATVLQAAGVTVLPQALTAQVYLPGRQGSLQVEMLATSRRYGVLAYSLTPRLEAVLQEVAAGHPVLVFQNLSLPVYPVWHYAVVTGFDNTRSLLTLHSGTTANMEISFSAFERTWARGDHWAMVALPPSELPATAAPDALALSAAALERNHPAAALQAYSRALQQWPTHRGLMLGLANATYATGDAAQAEHAFRALLDKHPDFADGWNNLAQLLVELGNKPAAQAAISKAIALGGPRQSVYLKLHEQLQKR
jgi:tetratricopeptide (TPR) repeat protein